MHICNHFVLGYQIMGFIMAFLHVYIYHYTSLPLSPAYFDGHIPALKIFPFWFLSYPCMFNYMLTLDSACKRQHIILFFSLLINYPLPSLFAFPIHLYLFLSFPFTAFATSISSVCKTMCTHTHMHMYTTHIHVHMYTHSFTHIHVYSHKHTHAQTETHTYFYIFKQLLYMNGNMQYLSSEPGFFCFCTVSPVRREVTGKS